MTGTLERIGIGKFKLAFEKLSRPLIDHAVAHGADENTTAKRILTEATRHIPDISLTGKELSQTVGEFLMKQAEHLWSGDRRAMVIAMRMILKAVGPVLAAATSVTTDLLERFVDKVASSDLVAAEDRLAQQDFIVVVPHYYGMKPFFRVVVENGQAALDHRGVPRVLNTDFIQFAERWLRENPKQKITRKKARGSDGETVEISPHAPWQVYTLQEYLQIVGSDHSLLDAGAVEQLRDTFAPSKAWDQKVTEGTWAVFRAAVRTQNALRRAGKRNWMDRQDFEKLIEKMFELQPPIVRLTEMVDKAYFHRIGEDPSLPCLFTEEALLELEDTLDVFLGGEQDRFTKIVRAVREIKQRAASGSSDVSPTRFMLAFVAVTSTIWAPLLGIVLLTLMSLGMAIKGITTPLGGTTNYLWFFGEFPTKVAAAWNVFAAGWLAFGITWFFPVFQAMTSWLRIFIPGLSEDWLKSLGRRIVAFGFVFIGGLEFYAIALNMTVMARLAILVVSGIGFGISMGLVEAGYEFDARKAVKVAAKPFMFLFGILPLGILFAYFGYFYLDGMGSGGILTQGLNNLWQLVLESKYLQGIVLLLGVLVVGVGVRWIEQARIMGDVAIKERIPGARLVMVGIVALAAAYIWFYKPNKPDDKDTKPAQAEVIKQTQQGKKVTSPAVVPVYQPAKRPVVHSHPSRAELCRQGKLSDASCDDIR